ncbi:MAG: hypothetical protein QM541_03085 [Flavobacterium sp.]|nr:hypothetical protein [Flavobacterium sp.]
MSLAVAYLKSRPLVSADAAIALKVLIYSDIFSYPLTLTEIFERSDIDAIESLKPALCELVRGGYVYFINGFYLLRNDKNLVEQRLIANKKAKKYLRIAKWVTALIKHFPFVRGVMLSGSISKNYIDKQSDIDYFIITAPNRLWVCRLFFIICQKLLFFNRCKFFCYNYMIDEQHLAIQHRTYYSAIEIVTLIPTYNGKIYRIFQRYNDWTKQYFPNANQHTTQYVPYTQSILQQTFEALFNNKFGEWADKKLMLLTQKNWRKKMAKSKFTNANELELKRFTAKAHTQNHYGSIMSLFTSRMQQYESLLNIKF